VIHKLNLWYTILEMYLYTIGLSRRSSPLSEIAFYTLRTYLLTLTRVYSSICMTIIAVITIIINCEHRPLTVNKSTPL